MSFSGVEFTSGGPSLSRRPIKQGGQRTHHFFSRLAAVGGNAPLASTAGSS